MSARIAAVLTALFITFVLGLPTAFAAIASPVLGWKHAFQGGAGFGSVKPRTVDLGGDPTGVVSSITWQHWGTAQAVGVGRGWCPGQSVASGHACRASLHLSRLGTCHGRRAYINLGFFFKPGRSWIAGAKLNACTGRFQR
jgi:hypothetical protein